MEVGRGRSVHAGRAAGASESRQRMRLCCCWEVNNQRADAAGCHPDVYSLCKVFAFGVMYCLYLVL